MFQFQEVVDALKDLAANDPAPQQSHCQLLEKYAKEVGYQNYHHFVQSLKHLPNEQFANVSLKLMRQICMKSWRSTALVPEKLAIEFFAFAFNRRYLVEKNPPMDLVKAKVDIHHNIANTD